MERKGVCRPGPKNGAFRSAPSAWCLGNISDYPHGSAYNPGKSPTFVITRPQLPVLTVAGGSETKVFALEPHPSGKSFGVAKRHSHRVYEAHYYEMWQGDQRGKFLMASHTSKSLSSGWRKARVRNFKEPAEPFPLLFCWGWLWKGGGGGAAHRVVAFFLVRMSQV